jgi:hypothetical protein
LEDVVCISSPGRARWADEACAKRREDTIRRIEEERGIIKYIENWKLRTENYS